MLIKMTTVKNIYDFINKIAPYNTQESFDNSGFMVGDFKKKVEKAIVCLDVTEKILYFAKKNKVDLIISHHPVIFSELKQIRSDSIVYKLINNNISCLSAHTNFDKCDGGVDDVFANSLSLENIENLKNGIGKIGNISEKLTPLDFAKFVKQRLKIEKIKIVCSNKTVKKIATICGSGGSYIQDALFAGADTIVTGDLKQEHFVDAHNFNYTLIDAGHFETEYGGVLKLKQTLESIFKDISFLILENENFIEII